MADEQLRQIKTGKQKPVKKQVKNIVQTPVKVEKIEDKKQEVKTDSQKTEERKTEKPVKKIAVPKVKKTESMVYGKSLPISLKQAVAISRFIKNRKIEVAISNLEKVINKKLAVPMKGELAHRKGKKLNGKSMMSGKYPLNASKQFIKILKSLNANSIANGMELENTIISEIIPNKAPNQLHRSGSTKFKRTHILIKAKEIKK